MKTGLVLEGGGMRGMYTAGILDVFMKNDITFDGVIGVSAGAIHGCSYVAKQKGRSIRYYKKYCNDKRFMSLRNLITTGDFVGVDFCYHELPDKLDVFDHDAFLSAHTEFYVTCSNVVSGRAEYIKITDMRKQIDYVRASASLPYASRIVEVDKMKLLDGGCCDSIPVKEFQKRGFEKCVVILTREKGYMKTEENVVLAKSFYHNYPRFVRAMEQRHIKYNRTIQEIEKMEKEGKIFVIRPSKSLNIGRVENDPDKIQKVYDEGRKDACKICDNMRDWLLN